MELPMINQGPEGDEIYIFKAISQNEGHNILENQLATLDDTILKVNGYALWLVRESKTAGKLTVDYIFWDKNSDSWNKGSMRMALTDKGWISENNLNVNVTLIPNMNAQIANNHKDSLQACILNVPGFLLSHRVNPSKSFQSIYEGYSSYQQTESKKANKPR